MNRFSMTALIIVILATIISCSPVEKPQPPAVKAPEQAILTKPAWQQEWEKVIAEAIKEGRVIVYSSSGPEVNEPVGNAFKEKYGIPVEFVLGKGALIVPKILSEHKAGLYLADVYVGGSTPIVTSLKPAGLLDKIEQALILPEVISPEYWYEKKVSYIDSEKLILYFIAAPWVSITINTDLVKKPEINSWRDLLDTRWKGKIAYSDPSVAGAALKDFGVWSQPDRLGLDYFRQLAKQEPFIARDDRILVEGLAKSKFSMGLSLKSELIGEFKKVGAHFVQILPSEGTYLMSAGGNMSLIKKAPHPNAARLFINWLLTKEAQTIYSKGYGYPSARVDVTTMYAEPERIRNPSVKYFWSDTEEFLLKQPEQAKMAREIFSSYIR